MFRNVSAYYLTWEAPSVSIVRAVSDWNEIDLLELFRKKTNAESFAREISDKTEPEFCVSEASGKELLRIISLVDQIDIDGKSYAISLDGTRFDGEEFPRPVPEELKEIFLHTMT